MTPTTDLQKLLAEATSGPWKQGATLTTAQTRRWTAAQMQANDAVERQRVFANFDFGDEGRSRVFIAETRAEANASLIAMAPELAARVIELEAENARLREGLEPFARVADVAHMGLNSRSHISDDSVVHAWVDGNEFYQITLGHFRDARAALKGGEI